MISIDGSMMEGGGQLLRMAITYSSILGEPISVYNIRAKRRKPGLKPQHLSTLQVAAKITGAKITGGALGSEEVTFQPNQIRGDTYHVDIGTAGSISLLLQCITPILLYADTPSTISIIGGTAVRWSPTLPFLENTVYAALRDMGANIETQVKRHGFYPKGGGEVTQSLEPVKMFKPLKLGEPEIKEIRGISYCGRLPKHVAERQASSAQKRLKELGPRVNIDTVVAEADLPSVGSFITLWTFGVNTYMGADSLGARGKPSEVVGEEAALKLRDSVRSGANLDQHTTDHMILPASLADGESYFKTEKITLHTLTAIKVAEIFTDAEFKVSGREGEPGSITVYGIGYKRG